ncbi:hypothetical protein TNCV_4057811 [Trichonephila clavipes]|nr:hypothetical protein TNCV_4057811 [Trichonephila clavipes]
MERHEVIVQQPLSVKCPDSNPNIEVLRAEGLFVCKDVMLFGCPCLPFSAPLQTQMLDKEDKECAAAEELRTQDYCRSICGLPCSMIIIYIPGQTELGKTKSLRTQLSVSKNTCTGEKQPLASDLSNTAGVKLIQFQRATAIDGLPAGCFSKNPLTS